MATAVMQMWLAGKKKTTLQCFRKIWSTNQEVKRTMNNVGLRFTGPQRIGIQIESIQQ